MKLELIHPIRLETQPVEGRRITRVYVGEHEVRAEPAVLEAAARVAIGAPLTDDQLRKLVDIGALAPSTLPASVPDRLALRPEVAIEIDLRAGSLSGPHGQRGRGVLPDQSLPIDLFVPPLRLAALQRLAREVQSTFALLARAAAGRGVALDPERATPVLVAVARERLAEDPILRLTVDEVEGEPFRLAPLAPLQEETVQYPIEMLTFRGDRDRGVAARGPAQRHAISSEDELRATGTLLGLLGRGVHGQEARALLGEHAARVAALTRALLTGGMLTEAPARPSLAELPDGAVQHLGHATLLARLGDDFVLIDPWLPPASAKDQRRGWSSADLPRLSAVLLTHHHWDHLNLETFLRIEKSVPVYVPARPEGAALWPKSAELLRTLGFQQVIPVSWGAELRFGRGRVVALPFYGEDPTRLGWIGNTWLLEQDGGRALVHVDSGTDAEGQSMVSTGALADAVAKYGPVDTVFATRRQERGLMLEYGWHFLLRPAEEWARPAENACNDAAFLAELAGTAGARRLVLYSEGGLDAYPTDTDFTRGSTPRARDQALQFLWDDEPAIRAAVEARGAKLHLSEPGERFVLAG